MTASARWPVTITHVDVADIGASPTRALGTSYLCVFWSDDVPVGQIYGTSTPGEPVHLDELAARAGVGPRHHVSAPKPHAIAPTASVVICTRDRPEQIKKCLTRLSRQHYPRYEVVVVDNEIGRAHV